MVHKMEGVTVTKGKPEPPKQSHQEKSPLACGQGKLNATQLTQHPYTVSLRLLATGNFLHLSTVHIRQDENNLSRTSLSID